MYSIIINPLSGNGLAARTLPTLMALLDEMRVIYRVDRAALAGDSRMLARRAAEEGLEGVIAVGGDGTFFEVVNGIGERGLEVIFAPCGTGNDFIKTFRLPRGTVAAVRAQLRSERRRIDLGKFNDQYFLNVAGSGFDVDVLIETERFKARFGGMRAYLLGVAHAIKRLRALGAEMTVDGGPAEQIESTLVSIGNGRYFGGGMKALPDAEPDDGWFDVVVARKVSKGLIGVLLGFFILGKHTKMKWLCRTFRCRALTLESPGMVVEADGEMFPADRVEFSVLPKALCTRLPAGK